MKNFYLISILFLFTACGQNQTVPASGANDQMHPNLEIRAEAKEDKAESNKKDGLSYSDLKGKVFAIGSITHFTDTCAFYFECDCCAGDLVFNPDSTFYVIDHCMADKSLASGKYFINKSTLTLSFSGICISKEYNWENEVDTTAIDFFMTDTITSPSLLTYTTTFCNNKIKLTRIDNKDIGIQTNFNYAEYMKVLKNEKFTRRLEKIKKNATKITFSQTPYV